MARSDLSSRLRLVAALLVATVGALAACSTDDPGAEPGPDDDGGAGGPDAATADAEGDAQPPEPPGEPLDLGDGAARTWRWLEIPGTTCRDGSPAGLAVSPSDASARVVIYLEGGGACFDATTCARNPATVDRKSGGSAGIFDRRNAANPVANDTLVFVPYCTGDVHAGANAEGNVPGVGPQRFVGYTNMTTFLRRVKATFPEAPQVLLTGSSAGGFGAAANYVQTARIFGSVPVTLVDDAGQLMRASYLATCLQAQWRSLWNLDATVIGACGADCASQADYLLAASRHAAKAYPRAAQGLVTSLEDATIRQFFGFGASDCTSYAALSGATFAAGVADLRAAHDDLPNHAVYTFGGSKHTALGDATYYATPAGAPSIAAWVGQLLEGRAEDVAAP